jgi:hypothetical protein
MWLTDVFNVLFPPPEVKTEDELWAEVLARREKRERDFQDLVVDHYVVVNKIRVKCDALIDELLKDPACPDAKDNFTFKMERFIMKELMKEDMFL